MDARPGPGDDGSDKALVVIGEHRLALATALVLQEMGFSVDMAVDGPAAVQWSLHAGYALIACGPGATAADLAIAFRVASPDARVVLLVGPAGAPDALDAFDIEVMEPPLDVNSLVAHFWPAAA